LTGFTGCYIQKINRICRKDLSPMW